MSELIQFSLEGKVARLTLDDGKANALSPAMIDAIHQGLDRAESEAAILVIGGRDGFFSAGFDLRIIESDAVAAEAMVASGGELLLRLYHFPIPVLTLCTGHAIGAGALLLLAADYRLAVDQPYKVVLNEVSAGFPLPGFAVELARDRLAARAITQALLCSYPFQPAGAREAGYLDEVVPVSMVDATLNGLLQYFGSLDGDAFADAKLRLRGVIKARIAEHQPIRF
ncbi:crotonase/enoyl-CoA hydratase family protein [Pseudomaricurvus alkylphenolicus]|uniref:crotonase/enoyl-CoA hydratase family protein n=1 Tax=Pseudomaricurvus alkylphenolicus TaxID=1306991 RepID=UPI00141FE670|nr:crotonase/enoyl-CoA hydratase family protein [Pseudomaricurvus alkylphenolicus]NIB42335.1 crotonase/enoyl-CoA hydratase family protein [Pseudomaricurvus alkylphenolicus]